jgi:hypothetical protein
MRSSQNELQPKRLGKLWAVGILSAFNLDPLGDELAVRSFEMITHGAGEVFHWVIDFTARPA